MQDDGSRAIILCPDTSVSVPLNNVVPIRSPYGLSASDIAFVPGLKQSMSSRVRDTLPGLLHRASHALSELLSARFGSRLSNAEVAFATLDESLASRVEFHLPPGVLGNHRLSYLGDSVLTSSVASYALCNSSSSKDFNRMRTAITSRSSLAEFYDSCFLRNVREVTSVLYPGPVTWELLLSSKPPTLAQKAEYVEAVLGLLSSMGEARAYHRLFLSIMTHRYQCQPDLPISIPAADLPYLTPIEAFPCYLQVPSILQTRDFKEEEID